MATTDPQLVWYEGSPVQGLLDATSGENQNIWYAGAPVAPITLLDSELTLNGSAGIGSAETLGSSGSVVLLDQVLTGSAGIPSSETFGSTGGHVELLNRTVTGSAGLVSAGALGTGGVVTGPIVGTSGLDSAELFGTGGTLFGHTLIGETGIPSSETFGVGTLGSVGGPLDGFFGISSAEAFGGSGKVAGPILGVSGIPSAEALGVGSLGSRLVGTAGIVSREVFGAGGKLTRGLLGLLGILSEETFGRSGAVLGLSNLNTNFAVYIGGVNRSDLLQCPSVRVDRQINFVGTASFKLVDEAKAYFPSIGEEVVLYFYNEDASAWVKVFAGEVDTVRTNLAPGGDALFHEVNCVDYGKALARRLVNKKFSGTAYGSVRAIMKDLNESFFIPEGLKWVDRGDPGVTVGDIEFSYEPLNSVMDRLAQVSGWEWQVDWDRNIYLYDRPASTMAAPFNVTEETVGINGEVWRNLAVRRDRGLFRNKQYLRSDTPVTTDPGSIGYALTKTYTFDTFTLNKEGAYQYRATPLRSDAGVYAICEGSAALWSVPALVWSATVRDDTYRGRVHGVDLVKWNGANQTVTKLSTPETSGQWIWNDTNSRGISEPNAAELIWSGRLNDPHNPAEGPQSGDTVRVVWRLDSPTGPTADVTYTFSTDAGGIYVKTQDDLLAVYGSLSIHWTELEDSALAGNVLGVTSIKLNGVAQTLSDWIFPGDGVTPSNGKLYHRLTHVTYPYNPALAVDVGDTLEVTWRLSTPASTPASTSSDWSDISNLATDYSTGIWEAVDDVVGITDAALLQEYSDSLLAKFGVFGLEVDFETDRFGLEPGQSITVNLPSLQVSSTACNVESLTLWEQAKRLLTCNARVSNQLQQRDAMTAFKRLIERLKRTMTRAEDRYTFVLAQTLPGITNPGLVTGTSMTNPLAITRNLTLKEVVVLSKVPNTGADVKLDINADGVSIFAPGTIATYPAGTAANTQVTIATFHDSPLTLPAGTLLTLDVDQVGSLIPGSDFTVFLTGYVS